MNIPWTKPDISLVKELLLSGKTYEQVGATLGRTKKSIEGINARFLHLNLRRSWSGGNNPNFGAKIVKRGKNNPLSIWKRANPGYQDGERNPSFGRKLSEDEIARKTVGIRAFNVSRRGKTYKEIYGEKRAIEIGRAMSAGAAIRISKQKGHSTKPELEVKKKLDELGIVYRYQFPIAFFCVDFFLPEIKMVIQVDGCYWHGCPKHFSELDLRQKNRVRLDHSCDSFLRNRGYKVLRIWECDIPHIDLKSQIKSMKGKKDGYIS